MATAPMPQPDPGQGAAPPPQGGNGSPPTPDQGGQGGQPQSSFQAPANPIQVLLAKWSEAAKQMASADPRLAAGAEKVREGIRDMQQATLTPPQPTPLGRQPQ